MPTLEEVKKDRKEFDGRAMHQRFFEYCEAHSIDATAETLSTWDEKYNDSRIREHFGSREQVYRLGLLESYRRFLVSYSIQIPNGGTVKLPNGRSYQPTVRGTRAVAGSRVRLQKITAGQLNVIREQFRTDVRQLLRTQKFFSLPPAEIRSIVLEELASLEDEKES